MTKIAFYTLGCKANQYETSVIERDAGELGYEVVDFSRPADIYIINTCAVTSHADKKSRLAIKAARKRNPKAKIVATGCLAEVFPDEIRKLRSADLIIKNSEKENIVKCILPHPVIPRSQSQYIKRPSPIGRGRKGEGFRIRENLMIETGCEELCSYCIVPSARGRVKSKPADEIIKEARDLAASGVKEIVLTGINLGAYGSDEERHTHNVSRFATGQPTTLPYIIDELSKIDGLLRIRLSSIEPLFITEGLIDSIAGTPKVCKHLHTPLQSGDDKILKTMNRKYSSKDYLNIIKMIKKKIPSIALNTDIIVGFPGEDEKAFNNTVSLIKKIGFSRIHAFHFSPRPGTPAAGFPDRVRPNDIRKRIAVLQKLRVFLMRKFAKGAAEHTQTILVESLDSSTGLIEGLTESYIRIILKGDADLIGKLIKVKIKKIRDEFAEGEII